MQNLGHGRQVTRPLAKGQHSIQRQRDGKPVSKGVERPALFIHSNWKRFSVWEAHVTEESSRFENRIPEEAKRWGNGGSSVPLSKTYNLYVQVSAKRTVRLSTNHQEQIHC